MKTLYLECGMGAAGDMLTAALLELIENKQAFLNRINHLGLPGVSVIAEPSVKCGITGTHMKVTVNGEEEDSRDAQSHPHDHGHSHEHDQLFHGVDALFCNKAAHQLRITCDAFHQVACGLAAHGG